MNATVHSIRHYFRRFRIELALFWIVSGALSVVLFREGNAEAVSRLKAAEILMVLVVVMRLTTAESLLRTTNGWHLRPLAKRNLSSARGILLVAALLPPLALRAGVWFVKTRPGWEDAFDLAWSDLLPLAVFLGVIVGVMRLAMKLRKREAGGLWLLLVAPLLVALASFWVSKTSFTGSQWSRVQDVRVLPRSVEEVMPAGDRRIGPPPLVDGSEAEVMARFPVAESRRRFGGFGCRLEQVSIEDNELRFLLTLESAEPLPRQDHLVFVARYADGSYSGPLRMDGGSFRTRVPFFERYGREVKLRFASPLSLPWNRMDGGRMLEGAELWVLRMTGEPYFPRRGPLELDAGKLGLATLELAHGDPFSANWRKQWRLIDPAHLLQWPAWSDSVWTGLVRPVFESADLFHLEGSLMARLKDDVRPARIVADRGMEEGVMDELMRRLNDGRPLDAGAVALMMEEREFPADGRAVHALTRVPDWNDLLEKTAQETFPETFGKLAEEAWRRSGGAAGRAPSRLALAGWVAKRGDADALRFLAREGDVRRLERLLEPGVGDPVNWLATHAVRYDAEKRIFVKEK